MNYKQKHQEDLEAAKGWLAIAKENNNTIAIQILEKFFPELKESEDERIRKAQLDYWRSVGGKEWYGVPVQETIAWLEKQGEQKTIKQIQWTGKNLKEVIDFTGKSARFDEWFKSWDEYETYVHSHGNIHTLNLSGITA